MLSDLYVVEAEGGGTPAQLTSGAWSDRTPAWSHDGSRLAFLSDRITPGYQLPHTMPADGGEPALATTLVGSAESATWSSAAPGCWCSPPIPARTGSTVALAP